MRRVALLNSSFCKKMSHEYELVPIAERYRISVLFYLVNEAQNWKRIMTECLETTQSTLTKGPGKRGHIVADTLLPTQMFPRLPARATFVADANFVSGIFFRNILCLQQMFPSLRSMETQHSFRVPRVCAPKKHHEQQCVRNNVSSFASALRK